MADNALSLIPEIFFDIIGRVIPGLILIILYQLPTCAMQITNLDIALELIASYVIGFLLEIITQTIEYVIYLGVRSVPIKIICHNYCYTDNKLWKCIRKSGNYLNSIKMMAEKSMFRSLTLVAIIIFIWPPRFLYHYFCFPILCSCDCIGFKLIIAILFALFLYSERVLYCWIIEKLKTEEEKKKDSKK